MRTLFVGFEELRDLLDMKISIGVTRPAREPSQADLRREDARLRAQASRATAKVRADLDGAICDSVAGLVSTRGSVPESLPWAEVLKGAYKGLRERGYDAEDAVAMIRSRLDPTAMSDLVAVIEQL